MTVLFLPIAFGMRHLYQWTDADVVAADEMLPAQAALPERAVLPRPRRHLLRGLERAVLLSERLVARAGPTGDPRLARRMQMLSAAGLLGYGLTITFASFDWLMSLAPHWFSTIYGVLIMGGQALSAMAFLIVALVWLGRRPPLDASSSRRTFTISAT